MKPETVTWDNLIEKLVELFQHDDVDEDEVMELMDRYKSNPKDWRPFAIFDKYKYTRNLVHEGNGKFNLMLLCWAEGNQSTIHDHAGAHCFMKVLDGTLKEVQYHWPTDETDPDGAMVESNCSEAKTNDVIYIHDRIGLHRVENTSHSSRAVSLHLYCPPFSSCSMFDERTGRQCTCQVTFWSKYGVKNSQPIRKTDITMTPSCSIGTTKE